MLTSLTSFSKSCKKMNAPNFWGVHFFIILIFNVSNVSNVSEDLPDELSFSLPEPVVQP